MVDILVASLGYGATFLAMVVVITVVHEFGHFLAARHFGVRVDVFAVGFGKELLGWTDSRGTRWKLCLLPLGGYVRMFGEGDRTDETRPRSMADAARSYATLPAGRRAAILLAGPLANLVFAVAALAALVLIVGRVVPSPEIGGVAPAGSAAAAGLHAGDRIIAVDGRPVDSFAAVDAVVAGAAGRDIVLTVTRDGMGRSVVVRPVTVARDGALRGDIGAVAAGRERVAVGPLAAGAFAFEQTVAFTAQNIAFVRQVATGARGLEDLAGPLRIAQISGRKVAELGLAALVVITAMLSVNVGLFNLLPIPLLDGGHLLFLAVERLRGRRVSHHVQRLCVVGGLTAVLAISLATTLNDILRLTS
ncbi:MAG: RIP metalloprotease [Dongiaceae bacterium]